jgi:vacuolar protein sorting-associated protein 13A/C
MQVHSTAQHSICQQFNMLHACLSPAAWDVYARTEHVLTLHGTAASTFSVVLPACLLAGVESAARQLPDSFCVSYGNSQASNTRLRIALQRQLDTELLDSQRIRAAAARAAAAGSSSSGAAAAAMADASSDAWRMSYGAALAQGRPLLLSLSVPVWVVNGTQLPISIGIVPHATTVNGDGSGLATPGDAPGLGEGGLLGSGAAVSGQLRVVDTEAYSQLTRPGGHVTIMGNSVELLSFPGEGPDGSGWGGGGPGGSSSGSQLGGARGGLSSSLEQAGLSSGVVQQWAAVISVMGSRWSSPLVLATAGDDGAVPGSGGEGTAPVAEAVARLPRYEPVLLRAKCRDGCVYDVTVRIESAGSSLPLSTVVRLDPHMVVSNRTGYTLHLMQPEPIWKALGTSLTGPTGGSMSSSRSSGMPGAWFMGDAASGSSATAQGRGPPTAASATPVRDATLVLRAGSLAVPLSWPQGCLRRLLLLTLPPTSAVRGAAAAAAAAAASNTLEAVDPVMWSEAFRVDYPATGVMQVLLPLYRLGTPGEPQPVDEASMAAAYAAFDSLLQQVPQQQQQQVKSDAAAAAGRPPLPSRPSSGGGRSSSSTSSRSPELPEPAVAPKPLLVHVAKRTEGGLLEYLAVTVNVAVEMPAPGCLHLVLQSLGGEPQQCLMNCTAAPISYRQATPRAAWQLLPPFSGAALVLLQPAGGLGGLLGVNTAASAGGDGSSSGTGLPSSAEVELRDTDPSTSGSAVCSLDTDSSGLAISQSAGKRSSSSGGAQGAELPATFAIAGGKAQALAQVSRLQGLLAG